MLTATPVFMEVRPFQVSNLCFEVSGILGDSRVELGTGVAAFDFGDLYTAFRNAEPPGAAADPGSSKDGLTFDSTEIDRVTSAGVINPKSPPEPPRAALANLRAESLRAALDKAIHARANAFITKYRKAAEIASLLKASASVKSTRLTRLANRSQQRTDKLLHAYQHSGRDETDVVTKTTTDIVAKNHEGPIVTTTTVDEKDEKTTNSTASHKFDLSAILVKDHDLAEAVETQSIENVGYDFRMPFIEEDMRNDRDQNTTSDQAISHFWQSHYLDRLEEVFDNELASIDADVNRMQVAYLNTILLSPIDGIITGVYKNPGDCVSAGEPVFRVENDGVVLIVANVVCRGPVSIGSILSITTTLFDGTGPPILPINAAIVAARGQGDDDQWEVIGKVANIDAAGKKIFPLGYRFDNDITQVTIFEPNEG